MCTFKTFCKKGCMRFYLKIEESLYNSSKINCSVGKSKVLFKQDPQLSVWHELLELKVKEVFEAPSKISLMFLYSFDPILVI